MKKALVLFALTTYLSAEKNVGEIIGKCLNSKAQVTSAKTPPVVPPRGPQGATSSSTGKSGGQRSLGDILKQKQQQGPKETEGQTQQGPKGPPPPPPFGPGGQKAPIQKQAASGSVQPSQSTPQTTIGTVYEGSLNDLSDAIQNYASQGIKGKDKVQCAFENNKLNCNKIADIIPKRELTEKEKQQAATAQKLQQEIQAGLKLRRAKIAGEKKSSDSSDDENWDTSGNN